MKANEIDMIKNNESVTAMQRMELMFMGMIPPCPARRCILRSLGFVPPIACEGAGCGLSLRRPVIDTKEW